MPGWEVQLRPPPLPLPAVPLTEGEIGDEGARNLATIAWAARRLGYPVVLAGRGEAADSAAERLREAGVALTLSNGASGDRVTARWASLPQ